MSREEIKKLIGGMIVAYPNYKPQDMNMTVQLWETMLADYSYQECMLGLQTYISTDKSGFAPSIGALINAIPRNKTVSLNEMEAWGLVSNALRNSTYNAEEEFAKLPEIVQKAVGSPSNLRHWAQTDLESVENVIQSNFMRTYRTEVKRAEEYERLPNMVKLAIKESERRNAIADDRGRDMQKLSLGEGQG